MKKVKIFKKNGGIYSGTLFDFDEAMSMDGTYLKTPQNVIMELKYPDLDIKGTMIR